MLFINENCSRPSYGEMLSFLVITESSVKAERKAKDAIPKRCYPYKNDAKHESECMIIVP